MTKKHTLTTADIEHGIRHAVALERLEQAASLITKARAGVDFWGYGNDIVKKFDACRTSLSELREYLADTNTDSSMVRK